MSVKCKAFNSWSLIKPMLKFPTFFTFFAFSIYGQLSVPLAAHYLEFQEGAPLQIIGVRLSVGRLDLLDQVQLINVSDKVILAYTLGWVLENKTTDQFDVPHIGPPVTQEVRPNQIAVSPGQKASIPQFYQVVRLRTFASPRLVVGVTSVQFSDGSKWSYELQSAGKFVEMSDDQLKLRISGIMQKYFAGSTLMRLDTKGCQQVPHISLHTHCSHL